MLSLPRFGWSSPAFRTLSRHPHWLALLFVFLSFTPVCHAASVTLAWDPSSGSITGYKLYRGTASKQYTVVTTVGSQAQCQVSNLVNGTKYYFAVKAYNAYGESGFSNELVYTVPANSAPVATNGVLTTTVNTQAAGTLKASDANGDALKYSLVTTGSKGKATLTNTSTGAFNYLPNSGVTGTDTFTFRVYDGKVYSNTATVGVTINPANRAPVAKNSSISTKINTRVYGKLIASDADGNSLTYTVVTKAGKGNAVITNSATGAFSYTPYTNKTGSDYFTFRVNDGKLNSNVATVNVTVTATGTTSASLTASSLETSQESDASKEDDVVITLEAEDAYLIAPMTLHSDPEASAGSCIEVPEGTGSISDPALDAGSAEYVFDVPVSGTYAIWGRVQSKGAQHNGFYLSVDSQPFIDWETGLGGDTSWIWSVLKAGKKSSPLFLELQAGQHVLMIKQKDDGTRIDQIMITSRPDHFRSTIYEDAEDQTTIAWEVADTGAEQSATVTNVFDEVCDSHVIELKGKGMRNEYALMADELVSWGNGSQTTLEWSISSSRKFQINVDIETTEGRRVLVYSPVGRERLGKNGQIHLGLGKDVVDGQWHTFVRDLQVDLQRFEPSAGLTQVNGFAFRGRGRVDNVSLR